MVRKRTREIKLSELALRESEARYRDLFENANDLIYTHDLRGNYTSVNECATRILGYSTEEFLKLNFTDIVDPEHLAVTQDNFRKKIENGEERTGPYEIRVRTKDGRPLWFEVTSRLLKEEGQPVGVHGIARDVTDHKLA